MITYVYLYVYIIIHIINVFFLYAFNDLEIWNTDRLFFFYFFFICVEHRNAVLRALSRHQRVHKAVKK